VAVDKFSTDFALLGISVIAESLVVSGRNIFVWMRYGYTTMTEM